MYWYWRGVEIPKWLESSGRFSSMSRSSDGQTRTYQVIERLYVGYPQYCHGQNYEVCDRILDNFSEVNAKNRTWWENIMVLTELNKYHHGIV